MGQYVPFPRVVRAEFREQVLDTFPAVADNTSKAQALLCMLEYVLFGSYRFDTAALLAPHSTISSLVGIHPKAAGYTSRDWLSLFEDELFPLNVEEHRYVAGKARVIRPEVPAAIRAGREQELPDDLRDVPRRRVGFVSGNPVSSRKFAAIMDSYEAQLAEETDRDCPIDHPAASLVELLNCQPRETLDRAIQGSWPDVRSAWAAMPHDEEHAARRRDAAERILNRLKDTRFTRYGTSEHTARIFAQGANLHLLPRELRKLALRGGFALDLRACQLAVVAKLWDMPALQSFLKAGASIWNSLCSFLALPPDAKRLLKDALYALVFGMSRKKLLVTLSDGKDLVAGIGSEKAERFFEHELIRELLASRTTAYQRVREAGGALDAFGRWISTSGRGAHKVIVQQAQSYEMSVMLAAYPVLDLPDVRVLSWLHDGLTVRVNNRTKAERRLKQVKRRVDERAEQLGLATEMQVEEG